MPGLSCYIGRTEDEAKEKYDYQNSLMHEVVAREILSTVLGNVDLSSYDFDGPLPGKSADVERQPEHVQIRHRACQARTTSPCARSRRLWPVPAPSW
jgi:alkanesulfonate monooxygenase SsuD/methylene tetrahydromethanopterin reductase-like flavin-dependent oxidoreductase (luciferase family)